MNWERGVQYGTLVITDSEAVSTVRYVAVTADYRPSMSCSARLPGFFLKFGARWLR